MVMTLAKSRYEFKAEIERIDSSPKVSRLSQELPRFAKRVAKRQGTSHQIIRLKARAKAYTDRAV